MWNTTVQSNRQISEGSQTWSYSTFFFRGLWWMSFRVRALIRSSMAGIPAAITGSDTTGGSIWEDARSWVAASVWMDVSWRSEKIEGVSSGVCCSTASRKGSSEHSLWMAGNVSPNRVVAGKLTGRVVLARGWDDNDCSRSLPEVSAAWNIQCSGFRSGVFGFICYA